MVTKNPQILRSKFKYYTAIIERVLTFFAIVTHSYILNLFYDSITNERNKNWSASERQTNIAALTSIYYLGTVIGALISPLIVDIHFKYMYNGLKLVALFSVIPFLYGGFFLMMVSRFLVGLFDEAIHVTLQWSLYQIALPRHREAAMNSLFVGTGICYIVYTLASIYDNGGVYYWRMVFLTPAVLLLLTTFVDVFLTGNLNSVNWLIKNVSRVDTVESLMEYYDRDTSEALFKEYAQKMKIRVIEEAELLEGDNNDANGARDRQNSPNRGAQGPGIQSGNEDPTNMEIAHSSKNIELEESFWVETDRDGPNTHQNGSENATFISKFISEFARYRVEGIHICFIILLIAFAYTEIFLQFGTYIGAKSMKDENAVAITKKFILVSACLKLATSIFSTIYVINYKRKFSTLVVHSATLFGVLLISIGYFLKNLMIARVSILINSVCLVVIYSNLYIYANDVCPASLVFLTSLVKRGSNTVFGIVVPLFVQFEFAGFAGVGWRFLVILAVGVVANVLLRVYMIETAGKSPRRISNELRGVVARIEVRGGGKE